jgi:hypothetical protein
MQQPSITLGPTYYYYTLGQKLCAQVMAAACLHMGAKVVDSPKHLHDVVTICEKIRHGNTDAIKEKLKDPVSHLVYSQGHVSLAMHR